MVMIMIMMMIMTLMIPHAGSIGQIQSVWGCFTYKGPN